MRMLIPFTVAMSVAFADSLPLEDPDRGVRENRGGHEHREIDDESLKEKFAGMLADSAREMDPDARRKFLDEWRDLIASALVTLPADDPGGSGPADAEPTGDWRADDGSLERARAYHAEHGGLSMLVMHRGEVVLEAYDNGGDAGTPQWLASGTKSFVGVLAAAAVEDGLIEWDQPAADILDEWRDDPAKKNITLRQLLNLTSGLRANPPGGALIGHSLADALEAPVVSRPGARYAYGANHFHAFAAALDRVLENERGIGIEQYLNERVLEPLGIGMGWRVRLEEGMPQLAGGGTMTARDWAVFGEFMRNRGRHDGRQLIAAEHLAECLEGTDANPAYGLTWWLNAEVPDPVLRRIPLLRRELGGVLESDQLPEDLHLAAGAGKQRLYVIPSLELVIVRQGRPRERGFRDEEFLMMLLFPDGGG